MTDHKATAEKIVRNIPIERMDLCGRLELRDEIIVALSGAERNAKPVVPDGHIYQCRGVKNDVPCSYLTTGPICTRCGTPSPFCTKAEVRDEALEEAARHIELAFNEEVGGRSDAIRSLKAKP